MTRPNGTSEARRAWGSLAREDIVAAAVELARAEGIDALTVRRLAAEIGAGRMSLYRHIPSKDALLDLVANAIAESHVIPEQALTGPWEQRLRHLAHSMREQLKCYPGFAELVMTRGNHGPGGLSIVETILDILTDAGLRDEVLARHCLVFVDIVLGRAHRELHGDPTSAERNAALLAAAESEDSAPRLRALAPHLRAITPEEIFETELDILVNAIWAANTS
ncbi:TetR/AcrR family transcriptional regulator [Pseudonocardia spinosispora]|uniref:TetR/AcrR family transcriptional regulator n=1 Tax=Pseudonocardia spinosispora TaxID=103441 RepID=UPI000429A5E0|nr:TetR/AcrR family transcriptional regulator C-terminal domain-containing protein [Pseudonocardia spinosispora]